MADPAPLDVPESAPSVWRWVLGFLIVGACWGLTTPFMRRAAVSRDQKPQPERPLLSDPSVSWLKRKIYGVIYAVFDLLKNPAYAIPLLLNVTGSVWFFLLIGQAGMALTTSQALRHKVLTGRRAESDCPNHELLGVPVHSDGGMVGRRKGYL